MEDMGAVSRERDENDRRHVTARLTESGRRLLEAVTPALEAVERARFGRLSETALQAMITSLAHVRETP
jgi:DNA-binding MarR family transcriptional regulator